MCELFVLLSISGGPVRAAGIVKHRQVWHYPGGNDCIACTIRVEYGGPLGSSRQLPHKYPAGYLLFKILYFCSKIIFAVGF